MYKTNFMHNHPCTPRRAKNISFSYRKYKLFLTSCLISLENFHFHDKSSIFSAVFNAKLIMGYYLPCHSCLVDRQRAHGSCLWYPCLVLLPASQNLKYVHAARVNKIGNQH